jgi:hypothetical protein
MHPAPSATQPTTAYLCTNARVFAESARGHRGGWVFARAPAHLGTGHPVRIIDHRSPTNRLPRITNSTTPLRDASETATGYGGYGYRVRRVRLPGTEPCSQPCRNPEIVIGSHYCRTSRTCRTRPNKDWLIVHKPAVPAAVPGPYPAVPLCTQSGTEVRQVRHNGHLSTISP